jgi:hypothetical protein
VRLYDGPSSCARNEAFSVIPDPAHGIVYACGMGEEGWPGATDILVTAYELDGRFVDATSVGGWTGSADRGYAMELDSAGRLFVCGSTEHPGSRSWDFTWARYEYDPAGDSLASPWVNKSFWPGPDAAFDLIRGHGNDLYLCGAAAPDTLNPYRSYLAVARINIDDASVRWLRLLSPDSSNGRCAPFPDPELPSELLSWDCYGAVVALDSAGDLVVAGSGYVRGLDREVWLAKLDTAGNVLTQTLWHAAEGDLEDALFDMTLTANGTIYGCGYCETEDGDLRALVLRADAALNVTGARLFGPAGEQTEAWASRLCVDGASGDVLVTGGLDDWDDGWQMLTQRFSPTLVPRWPEPGVVLGGIDDDRGVDVTVHNGQTIVTGDLDDELAVVCLGQMGNPLWTWRYGSPDSIGAIGAALACCGDALLVGGSVNRGVGEWSSLVLARLDAGSGLAEAAAPAAPRSPPTTVIRGVLSLPSSTAPRSSSLLDAAGHRVLDLTPGANDISGLAPGVYFVRSTLDNRQSPVSKVVITR